MSQELKKQQQEIEWRKAILFLKSKIIIPIEETKEETEKKKNKKKNK